MPPRPMAFTGCSFLTTEPETIDATIALEQEVGGLPADIPPTEQWLNDTFVKSYLERNGSQ